MPFAAVATLVAAGSLASAVPPPNVLAVELAVDIDYVDPALSYYVPAWTIEYATCAKLLNHPDLNAPVGGLLQPEVAAGMPSVSPDGRTYTFLIRDDFFFAPSGERVSAAHFKHAIDRDLNMNMSSPSQPFLRDIEGAEAVIRGDTNSTSGVVVDGNTLRITLLAPSADFLARLTMPFFCPLPLSVGINPDGIQAPVPSAGPYYIESWAPNTAIVIKENPFYTGDRPHHFDEIRYGIGRPLDEIKLRIDTGDTDWGDIPPAAHADLALQYGPGSPAALLGRQRWFAYPSPTVLYLAMNHDRQLFGSGGSLGNVSLKRAVNYAIDRTAMMAQRGAYAGAPTDQHLPYEMPGFRDVEIYPSRPNLVEARRLAGCTGDTPNTCPPRTGVFYCANAAPAPQICQIVQANLLQIGLNLEIMLFPRAVQFELAGRRGEPFDMTLEGWHMDYYDPFDFLFLLDGEGLQPANNVNFAYFNDPGYNARIDAANLLIGAARANAFGDLDIDIARDAAPWAPYGVTNDRYYFSERIGCQAYVPPYTISLGALCVRPATSIGDVGVAEGDSGSSAASFTLTLAEAAPTDYPVTVAYSTVDGTAGSGDYVPQSGSVTFESGEKTKTISIEVVGDTAHETDETFGIQLSNATKGTIVDARGTATIRNDDAAPPPPPPPPQPDTQAPADPVLQSLSHTPGRASRDRTVEVSWSGAADTESGVDGFSFHWDRQPTSLPDTLKDVEETVTRTTSPVLANGRWYFHLRTRDNAGNWTSTRHLGPYVIVSPPVRCVVPNVKRKTIAQARRLLASKRCALGRVARAYSGKVKTGRVISQSRRPGARLARGTRVNVVVSRGKRRR
jgi:peptide/nickel transport system substrate-binding protein